MRIGTGHALRQLRREWRSGELVALALSLLVAVGAVTAVSAHGERIERSLMRGAGEIIAADLKVSGRQPIPDNWLARANTAGLASAEVATFPSVIFRDGITQLIAVKGVSSGYPLRGELTIRSADPGPASDVNWGPTAGEAWVETRLLSVLGLELGDQLELGSAQFTVSAVIAYEPDKGESFVSLAPRVMVRLGDLKKSGLLGPASRAQYALLVAGTELAVERFRQGIAPLLGLDYRIIDLKEAQLQVGSTLQRAQNFIGLAALGAILLAGIAIAVSAGRYAARHRTNVALLRCFGADRAAVLGLHVRVLLLLALLVGSIGVALGYGVESVIAQIARQVLTGELGSTGWRSAATSLGLGVVLLLGFSVPALATLNTVTPIQVLQRGAVTAAARWRHLYYVLPVAALALLALAQSTDIKIVTYVLGGSIAGLLAMMGLSAVLLRALKAISRGVGVSWRFGLARLFRHTLSSSLQIASISLGLTIILLLTLVRAQLFAAWQTRLPANAPNYFLANIQPHEQAGVDELFTQAGVSATYAPMAVGRLVSINGQIPDPAQYPDARASSRIEGNLNFSWAENLPSGNSLEAGTWWGEGPRHGQVSLARSWAEPLGVHIGDQLGFQVGAQELQATISSIRSVTWDSFEPNFFILFPPGAFPLTPRTLLTAIHLDEPQEVLLADLARGFPTVNIIDIGAILAQVRRIIDIVSLGLNLVFGFTVAAGALVLVATLSATRDARVYEAAVLKALGCDRRRLLASLNTEFLVMGALAGTVAAVAAALIGRILATRVFYIDYTPNLLLLLVSVSAAVLLVWLASRAGMRKVLATPPALVLKEA